MHPHQMSPQCAGHSAGSSSPQSHLRTWTNRVSSACWASLFHQLPPPCILKSPDSGTTNSPLRTSIVCFRNVVSFSWSLKQCPRGPPSPLHTQCRANPVPSFCMQPRQDATSYERNRKRYWGPPKQTGSWSSTTKTKANKCYMKNVKGTKCSIFRLFFIFYFFLEVPI